MARNSARTWNAALALLALTLPSLLDSLSASSDTAPDATQAAIARLVDYVRSRQAEDGSFRSEDGGATDLGAFLSPLAIQALSGANLDPRNVRAKPETPSSMDWLRDHLYLYDAHKATEWEKQILAIAAGYEDPRNFNMVDYAEALRKLFVNGQMGDPAYLNDDMFGILALRAANYGTDDSIVGALKDYLVSKQNADGSWGATPAGSGDVDMTAAGLAAIMAGGARANETEPQAAIAWLHNHQTPSGGLATSGTKPNLQSTAWALWGLRSAGEDPSSASWWTATGATPASWLVSTVGPTGKVRDASGVERGPWEAIDVLLGLTTPRYPVGAPLPVAPFKVDEAPAGTPTRFHAGQPGRAYLWDFGDGEQSTQAEPQHTYAKAGTYTVSLTLWDGDYGKGRTYASVQVEESPGQSTQPTTSSSATPQQFPTTTAQETPSVPGDPATVHGPQTVPAENASTTGWIGIGLALVLAVLAVGTIRRQPRP